MANPGGPARSATRASSVTGRNAGRGVSASGASAERSAMRPVTARSMPDNCAGAAMLPFTASVAPCASAASSIG